MGTSGQAAEPPGRLRRVPIAAATALALLMPAAPPPAVGAAEAAGDAPSTITRLDVGATAVEVRNGTPGLERLLRWAFDQFTARGLGAPRVASVTFRARDTCTGVTGWISGGEVTVCFVHQEACLDLRCTHWRPWVKRTAMHELAHAWMSEQLTSDQIEEFLAVTGLPTWSSDAWPWERRGVELAAETIAWASQDQPARVNARLGNPSCADLTRYYRVLTGHPLDPNPQCSRVGRGDRSPGGPPSQEAWTHTEPSPGGSTCIIRLATAGADTRLAPTVTTAPAAGQAPLPPQAHEQAAGRAPSASPADAQVLSPPQAHAQAAPPADAQVPSPQQAHAQAAGRARVTAQAPRHPCLPVSPRSVRVAERVPQGRASAALGAGAHPSTAPPSPTEGAPTMRTITAAASALLALTSAVPALPAPAAPAAEPSQAQARVVPDPGAPAAGASSSCASRGFAVGCSATGSAVPQRTAPHGALAALATESRVVARPATGVPAAAPHGAGAALSAELAGTALDDRRIAEEQRAVARVRAHAGTRRSGVGSAAPHGAGAALSAELAGTALDDRRIAEEQRAVARVRAHAGTRRSGVGSAAPHGADAALGSDTGG